MTVGRMLGLAVLGALCGCSLLLDTSEFRTDQRERELRVDGIEPIQITEGAMEPVIVRGQGFTESVIVNAVVLLPGGREQAVPIADRLESPDGSELGLLLEVPVLSEYSPDPMQDPASVRIELKRGDTQVEDTLELQALPELMLEAEEILDTDKMAERYSEINVTGAARVRGTQPARLVATSAIRINGTLNASGDDAGSELPGAAGPGGCPGGAGGTAGAGGRAGDCESGGGRAGMGSMADLGPGGSGGGGGCAVAGSSSESAAGGEALCGRELVPLGESGNRGHGGGGGGSFDTATGGGGGGGGGVIALDAPLVVLNAQVNVLGGNGAPGGSLACDPPQYAGSGGGGAGGVVLVRADTLVVTERDRISTAGGLGGSTCDGRATGGNGAAGRVRIDVATLQSSAVDDLEDIVFLFSRNVWQGPRLAASTPRLTLSGAIPIGVRGDAAQTYALRVDRDQPVEISGEQTKELALERGLREICVLVQGVDPELAESKHCLTIAVLAP